MEIIYKNIENDNAENILKTVNFSKELPPDDLGEWMSIEEFMKKIENYEIIDCIGNGFLEIDGKMVDDSESWIFCDCFKVSNEYIISFNKLKEIFGNRIRILWISKF